MIPDPKGFRVKCLKCNKTYRPVENNEGVLHVCKEKKVIPFHNRFDMVTPEGVLHICKEKTCKVFTEKCYDHPECMKTLKGREKPKKEKLEARIKQARQEGYEAGIKESEKG